MDNLHDRPIFIEAEPFRSHRHVTPSREIWGWVAPWLAGALLSMGALLGFLTSSGANDEATYIVGFVTAGLCLGALVWGMKAFIDGRRVALVVDREDSLLVLVALLAVLAIGGLFLAANFGGAVAAVGYAGFGVGLATIAINLKHYFDRHDGG